MEEMTIVLNRAKMVGFKRGKSVAHTRAFRRYRKTCKQFPNGHRMLRSFTSDSLLNRPTLLGVITEPEKPNFVKFDWSKQLHVISPSRIHTIKFV